MRKWMDHPTWRKIFLDHPAEPRPLQLVPLTSSHQRMPPSAAHFCAEGVQPTHIAWYCVVIEISFYHSPQPASYNRDRFMASSHQSLTYRRQRCTHPLLDCQPDDLETFAILATAVRKTEKVKCLRLSSSTFPASFRSVSPKLDKPRFVRMKFQFEFGQAFSHCC